MAPDVGYIRDSPLAIIGCVLKDRADGNLAFGESVYEFEVRFVHHNENSQLCMRGLIS